MRRATYDNVTVGTRLRLNGYQLYVLSKTSRHVEVKYMADAIYSYVTQKTIRHTRKDFDKRRYVLVSEPPVTTYRMEDMKE